MGSTCLDLKCKLKLEPVAIARGIAEMTVAHAVFPTIARLRFRLTAVDRIHLPTYAGSTWRGLLGRGLRLAACVTRQSRCEGCLLIGNCVYANLFETQAPPGKVAGRFSAAPRPFVLEPDTVGPRDIAPGGQLVFGLTLIGPVLEQIPSLIYALKHAGHLGLGRAAGRFELDTLVCESVSGSGDWQTLYAGRSGGYTPPALAPCVLPVPPRMARLTLYTPLRLKRRGHFVGARDFNAPDFLLSLCSRLHMLSDHYGGDPHAFDWQRLYQVSETVTVADRQLHWREWTRYSSRQDTLMQMGGLLGEFSLHGETLPAFWPALWYGQWVHMGKGTTFGLGGYRLAQDDDCACGQNGESSLPS